MIKTTALIAAAAAILTPLSPANAGEADIIEADVSCDGATCRFSVTVQHADEGWDHYADKWEVLDTQRNVLGVRELAHPHETEQPFTRSLGGVQIPGDLERVVIRAHDSVHGYGGREITVDIP